MVQELHLLGPKLLLIFLAFFPWQKRNLYKDGVVCFSQREQDLCVLFTTPSCWRTYLLHGRLENKLIQSNLWRLSSFCPQERSSFLFNLQILYFCVIFWIVYSFFELDCILLRAHPVPAAICYWFYIIVCNAPLASFSTPANEHFMFGRELPWKRISKGHWMSVVEGAPQALFSEDLEWGRVSCLLTLFLTGPTAAENILSINYQ